MADIYCPKCAEPWDIAEFHEVEDLTYSQAYSSFRSEGCKVFTEQDCTPEVSSFRAEASSILMDLLGDDVDGVASLLDDFEFAGMLDE